MPERGRQPDTERALREEAAAWLRTAYAGVFTDAGTEGHLRDSVDLAASGGRLREVLGLRPGLAGGRWLDLGCGFGTFPLAARLAGLDARGLDLPGFPLAFARRRLAAWRAADAPEAIYVAGDARTIPFADRAFSLVTLWNVLEHVRDPRRVLAEAHRVLEPGGLLWGISPNYAAFRREAHYHVPWVPLLPRRMALAYLRALGRDVAYFREHIYYVTSRGLRGMLEKQGFRLIDPRLEKLANPERIVAPGRRRIAAVLGRPGVRPVARVAASLLAANPLASEIPFTAVREP